MGGWLLSRKAVGISAQDKARRKERLSPALGDKAPVSPQLLWRAARLYHPCCGSQARPAGSENPCSIPREQSCPHTQLGSSCFRPAFRLFGRSHIHTMGCGSGEGGAGRLSEAFLYKRRRGVMVRAQDRELGHPGWDLCWQTEQPGRPGDIPRLCEPDPALLKAFLLRSLVLC